MALLSRFAGGFGGGSFTGTAFATASDAVPVPERGRALGWLITGQSLALVIGVPPVAYLGGVPRLARLAGDPGAADRGGGAGLGGGAGQPRREHTEAASTTSVLRLLTPKVVALLSANTMERFCYGGVAVYLATYLITSYGTSLEALALGLGVVALGNLLGSLVGGELSDRLRSRTVLAALSLAATGLLALPLLLWQPGLLASIALGFAYTAATRSAARPAGLDQRGLERGPRRPARRQHDVRELRLAWGAGVRRLADRHDGVPGLRGADGGGGAAGGGAGGRRASEAGPGRNV